jgi:hypothetical protein
MGNKQAWGNLTQQQQQQQQHQQQQRNSLQEVREQL